METTTIYDATSALNRLRELEEQQALRERTEEEHRKNPPFVQLTKNKIDSLRGYIRQNPLAVDIFLFIAKNMGKDNILICSIDILMEETGKSRSTVHRAIRFLKENNVIVAVKFGSCTGYAVDGHYVWTTFNCEGRYAVFEKARALASRSENEAVFKKLNVAFKMDKKQ